MDWYFLIGGLTGGAMIIAYGSRARGLREGQRLAFQGIGLAVMVGAAAMVAGV